MRRAIVPAQITTVEDKIAGNVSVQQAILLGIPLLCGFCSALFLPPFGQMVGYKVVLCAVLVLLFGSLAIRIKDHIVLWWVILLARYVSRPRYFVYDKNTTYLRAHPEIESAVEEPGSRESEDTVIQAVQVTTEEKVRLKQLAGSGGMSVTFRVGRRGRLNVHVSQAK